ncbi:siderophore-interacting protein [Streptomyces purpurascens]
MNCLLDALGSAPATVWFEGGGEDLPFRTDPARHELRHVPRQDSGAQLVDRVKTDLPGLLQGAFNPCVDRLRHGDDPDPGGVRTQGTGPAQAAGAGGLGYWRAS